MCKDFKDINVLRDNGTNLKSFEVDNYLGTVSTVSYCTQAQTLLV
jgi:hypothetical protein